MSKKLVFFDTWINKIWGIKYLNKKEIDSQKFKNENDFWEYFLDWDYFFAHNYFGYDNQNLLKIEQKNKKIIDTLYLHTLFCINEQNHNIQKTENNDVIEDSQKCREFMINLYKEFKKIDQDIKKVLYTILYQEKEFKYFFEFFIEFEQDTQIHLLSKNELVSQIKAIFEEDCSNDFLSWINYYVENHPQALAYCIMKQYYWTNPNFPKWVLYSIDKISEVWEFIKFWEKKEEEIESISKKYLYNYFGFENFKSNNQKEWVIKSLQSKNLILGLPTWWWKSLIFQLPALIHSQKSWKLTVVITPLKALMEDQVNNLINKGIYDAALLNSDLNPLEREEIENKIVSKEIWILYTTPEKLRSESFFDLLKERQIDRFVIDEAHCLIDRGFDFRPDYLFIWDFIRKLEKATSQTINISCFSATTKKDVLDWIKNEFYNKAEKKFECITSSVERKNLNFFVNKVEDKNKPDKLLNFLENCDINNNPTIIFVRKTEHNQNKQDLSYAENLANFLKENWYEAKFFHWQMNDVEKKQIQNEFIKWRLNLIVATKAFGMWIDKENIRYVIHYNIPWSLEEYLQEAWRAWRDDEQSFCSVYLSDDDINELYKWEKMNDIKIWEINRVYNNILKKSNNQKWCYISPKKMCKGLWIEENKFKKIIMILEKFWYIQRWFNKTQVFVSKNEIKNLNNCNRKIDNLFKNQKEIEVAKDMAKKLYNFKSFSLEEISIEYNIWVSKVQEIINKMKKNNIASESEKNDWDIVIEFKENKLLGKYKNIIDEVINYFEKKPQFTKYEFIKSILEIDNPKEEILLEKLLNYLVYNKYVKTFYKYFKVLEKPSEIKKKLDENIYWSQKLEDFFVINNKKWYKWSIIKFSYEDFNYFLYQNDINQQNVENIKHYLLFMHTLSIINIKYWLLVFWTRYNIERISDVGEFKKEDYNKLQKLDNKKLKINALKKYFQIFIENKNKEEFLQDYFNLTSDKLAEKYSLK